MSQAGLSDVLRETLGVFETVDPGTPLTTSEVTEHLDVGRRSTYSRLERLSDRELVETKEVGARGRVWWRPVQTTTDGADGRTAAPVDYESLVATLPGMAYRYRTDETPTIEHVGDTCSAVTGYSSTVFESDTLDWYADVVHPEDAERVRAEVEGQLARTGQFTTQYRILDRTGEVRWLWDHGRAVGGDPPDHTAVEGTAIEITDEKRVEEGLRERERKFRSMLDSVDEYAIVMLNVDGQVETWNKGAVEITGYEPDDAIGEPISTFYTADNRNEKRPERLLADAAENNIVEDEGWRVRADGSQFFASVTISAIRDDDGSLSGYTTVMRDMTDRRAREREIHRERDHFDLVLENSPNGVAVFRPDGMADRINQRFVELLRLDDSEAANYELGMKELQDGDGEPLPWADRPAQQALATGERVTDQRVLVEYEDGQRRWLSVDAAPIPFETGRGVVASIVDVTQLEVQARRLESRRSELESELEDIFARIDDAFCALDDDWRVTYVNERAAELLGEDRAALLGSVFWDEFPSIGEFDVDDALRRAMETQEPVTYDEQFPPLDRWLELRIHPSESGLSVYFDDITERKRREQELEEYERIIETLNDGLYVVDADGYFTFVNERFTSIMGYSRDELVGSHVSEIVGEEVVETGRRVDRKLRFGECDGVTLEVEVEDSAGDPFHAETTFTLVSDAEDTSRVAVVRDVTERVERQRELEQYETILETVHDGIYVLDEDYHYLVVNDAYVEMTGYSREELLGEHCSMVVGDEISGVAADLVRRLDDGEHSVVEAELLREDGEELLAESRFSPLTGPDGSYDGSVGVIRDVTERKQREEALERNREHLTVLNDLDGVVRDITDAVIDQSTREEIEQVVCDGLARSDSYCFAWVGGIDSVTQSIQVRSAVGPDGPLDSPISFSPDVDYPAAKAIAEQERQVVRDVSSSRIESRWPSLSADDVDSCAAIPILYEGTLYGVLNVYTGRPDAFTGDEEAVIGHLAEVIGHAIAAVERKRALLSDEVVELEFVVRDYLDDLESPCATDGRLSLERWVPAGDGTYLAYGTASETMLGTLDALVEERTHLQEKTVLEESDGRARFELRMSEPPVLSTITDYGGYIEEAVIDDDDYHVRVHLIPNADVRDVIGLVQEALPAARLVSRQQVSREIDSEIRTTQVLSERLTDRQRTALEAAFYSGYFEWPRKSSGQDIADAMGIAPPTFHQLLRRAHQELLDAVLVGPRSY